MIGLELGNVVIVARVAPLEEREGACLMQLRVVQNDQAGEMEEVGPHVVVTGGVSELEDSEIVRLPAMLPDEIMRAEFARR